MQPSKYQQQGLNWIESGQGNALYNSVAGSGKTTSLNLVAKKLLSLGYKTDQIRIIVFGKQNSLDLVAKFGQEWKGSISTCHSLGFRILQQEIGKFNQYEYKLIKKNPKYRKIARNLGFLSTKCQAGSLVKRKYITREDHFLVLINLVRLTLADFTVEAVSDLVEHHNLEEIVEVEPVTAALTQILLQGQTEAIDHHRIDYTDMIWLPVHWQLWHKPWYRKYAWVLVDEAQDLNAAQLELSLSLRSAGGRSFYVGDRHQAIFGWAGADNESILNIIQRTQAQELSLSLCYRCPRSHLALVQSIYPHIPIEASNHAPEGILATVEQDTLWDEDSPARLLVGDMVLCRKTAPLVSLCLKLIARGIKAKVKGRDIGRHIKLELETISKVQGFSYKNFLRHLEEYRLFKYRVYSSFDNEEYLKENLADKLQAITVIYSSNPQAESILDLGTCIDVLFSDKKSPITLSTVHRAKGLEGERVFLLKPEDMPMRWERQKRWQKEQEDNILYVALTRSKSALYIVGNPPWFGEDDSEDNDTKQNSRSFLPQSTLEADAELFDLPCAYPVQPSSSIPLESEVELGSSKTEEQLLSGIDLIVEQIEQLSYEQRVELLTILELKINLEKRQRVTQLMLSQPSLSDRAIARQCQVSAPTVGAVRKNLVAEGKILPRQPRSG